MVFSISFMESKVQFFQWKQLFQLKDREVPLGGLRGMGERGDRKVR